MVKILLSVCYLLREGPISGMTEKGVDKLTTDIMNSVPRMGRKQRCSPVPVNMAQCGYHRDVHVEGPGHF